MIDIRNMDNFYWPYYGHQFSHKFDVKNKDTRTVMSNDIPDNDVRNMDSDVRNSDEIRVLIPDVES